MRAILQAILLWTTRHFVWFVVIVALLVSYNLVREELNEHKSLTNDRAVLRESKQEVEAYFQDNARDTTSRIKQFERASRDRLIWRIKAIDVEIRQKKAEQKKQGAISSLLSSSPLGAGYLDYLKRDVEIKLLQHERKYLSDLAGYSYAVLRRKDAYRKLEAFRLAHVAAYAKLERIARQLDRTDRREFCGKSLMSELLEQFPTQYQELTKACRANAVAAANYKKQRSFVEKISRFKRPGSFVADPATANFALAQLGGAIAERDKLVQDNWVEKATGPVINVLPTASLILLSAILTPIAIKAFFYFVAAPLAARRPPINLFPKPSASVNEQGNTPPRDFNISKISAVSFTVTVDPQHELLIHPDYLQSSSVNGTKQTKWLMDWSYPMSSLASGMIALTHIRTSESEVFVISATRDPLSEVGMISVAEGSALVFKPHSLVGILQRKDNPVRITSAWRFNLHAWLTLQFRYLIFHGPAQLIVKGCRGIRIEKAATGRSINQAATLGFTAHLNYSTMRCETFGAYLMGRDELFNDFFTGDGIYIYEEMPNPGRKYGIWGRGIEGVTDSLLNVFGI